MSRYNFTIGKKLLDRYEIIEHIGKGSYGDVFKCLDNEDLNEYAIKIYKSGEKYIKSIEEEIQILVDLNDKMEKEYISKIISVFNINEHVCSNLKLYGENLYQYWKFNYEIVTINFIEKIFNDILKGLKFIHKNKIIHADIKPENILFKLNSTEIVICDFSLSQKLQNKTRRFKYEVQSIWYRAPEISIKIDYNCAIDIFSLGTILYELLFNEPLFRCKTDHELLLKIVEFLGNPPIELINSNYKWLTYFNNNGTILNNRDKRGKIYYPFNKHVSYRYLLKKYKDEHKIYGLVNKMKICLKWDYKKRIL